MTNLDLDLLRTFLAFADGGSFTLVGRTQSAVSMQMKRLEELVARPLFERLGRSMRLTPDGEVLVGYARRMLALNEEAVNRFSEPALTGTAAPAAYAMVPPVSLNGTVPSWNWASVTRPWTSWNAASAPEQPRSGSSSSPKL